MFPRTKYSFAAPDEQSLCRCLKAGDGLIFDAVWGRLRRGCPAQLVSKVCAQQAECLADVIALTGI